MRNIILLCMILVPIVTFLTILGIGYFTFTRTTEVRTVLHMKRIVKDHQQMIDSFLQERKGDLEFVADTYAFEDLVSPNILRRVLERLQRKSPAFFDLGVFDQSGLHVAYQGPYKLTGKIYSDEDWFKTVLDQGYYVSDVFLGFRKAPHFIIAITRNMNGQKWVIRATIDTYRFNDLVEDVRIGKTGEAYIINSKGILQTKRRSGGTLLEKDMESDTFPDFNSGIRSFFQTSTQGVAYLYTVTWMKDKNWLLVVRQEKTDAFKAIRSATYLVVIIILIGCMIIVGIAFYLTDRIIRRMDRLDSEKMQLNQQLIGATRLAELGEIAAGFAHEINNPLQIIKSEHSLIKMILSELKDTEKYNGSAVIKEINDSMNQIDLQISRCANITQAILKFGRQGEPKPRNFNLNEVLSDAVKMIRKKAAVNNISITEEYTKLPVMVYGEPAELQQVLLNLLNNAMDAIGEKENASGGRISIRAVPEEDRRVRIEVSDNGIGISPENMDEIFKPFFTTKPAGKGTGLGLSVCYGIIDKMGGTMDVKGKCGLGTTFTIHLPVVS